MKIDSATYWFAATDPFRPYALENFLKFYLMGEQGGAFWLSRGRARELVMNR
jgi:hypothetical protein